MSGVKTRAYHQIIKQAHCPQGFHGHPQGLWLVSYGLDIKASKGTTETTALQREGEAEQAGGSLEF